MYRHSKPPEWLLALPHPQGGGEHSGDEELTSGRVVQTDGGRESLL